MYVRAVHLVLLKGKFTKEKRLQCLIIGIVLQQNRLEKKTNSGVLTDLTAYQPLPFPQRVAGKQRGAVLLLTLKWEVAVTDGARWWDTGPLC